MPSVTGEGYSSDYGYSYSVSTLPPAAPELIGESSIASDYQAGEKPGTIAIVAAAIGALFLLL